MRSLRLPPSISTGVMVLGLLLVCLGSPAAASTPTYTCDGRRATIVGTPEVKYGNDRHDGRDVLVGTSGDDVIVGLSGKDHIDGGGGNDTICGGQDDDVIHGGPGDDVIFGHSQDFDRVDGGGDIMHGDAGRDVLYGSPDAGNELYGGPGNDRLRAFASATLDGGAGDDHLLGSDEIDTMRPGAGSDVVRARGPDVGDVLDLAGNGATTFDMNTGVARGNGETDKVSGVESVLGSEGNDVILGTARSDWIDGRGGDDDIRGRGGADILYGDSRYSAAGDDVIRGGGGDDRLIYSGGAGGDVDDFHGGPGDDTLELEFDVAAARVDLASQRMEILGNVFVVRGIENVEGSDADDWIAGNGRANRLSGGGGADIILGRNGDDTLYGSSGDDRIKGGKGDDAMRGGYGHDELAGGAGTDMADGGAGIDSCFAEAMRRCE